MNLPHLYFFGFYSLLAGLYIASFLNVCIWRIPRKESVVSPGSHCPDCNAPIRWYQNIPILSYVLLGAKCANCKRPISMRYAIVEAMGGVLFLASYLQWAMPEFSGCMPPVGLRPLAGLGCVPVCWAVFSGLILGVFIELRHHYLPRRVTVGGMVLGVAASVFLPELQSAHTWSGGLCCSVAGLLSGLLAFLCWRWSVSRLSGKAVTCSGEMMLMGAVGAIFGPVAVLAVLSASLVVSVVVSIAVVQFRTQVFSAPEPIPFGLSIAVMTVVWMFWGHHLTGLCSVFSLLR